MLKPKLLCLALICLSFTQAQQWKLLGTPISKPVRSMTSFKSALCASYDSLTGPNGPCTIWSSNSSWNMCSNLSNATPNYCVYATATTLYTGRYYGQGVYKTSAPINWSPAGLSNLSRNTLCKVFIETPWALLVGTYGSQSGIYKLSTGAGSWVTDNQGLTGKQKDINALDTFAHLAYAATDGGVCEYHQGKWAVIDPNGALKGLRILSVKVVNGKDIFAGTANNGVYHATSSDNGATWSAFKAFNTGLSGMQVNAFYVRRDSLYAGMTGGSKPLYVSARRNNAWNNWTDVSNGITMRSVFALAVNAGILYCGTEAGIFKNAW